jgi:site-specific DNA-methyltransferase (adenine-specific)
VQLFNDDCLKILPTIPDNSIDLIITSPPYNLGNKHHTGNKYHQSYNDNLPEIIYQEQQLNLLNQCYRILKSDGSIMYNHKNRIKDGVQITPYEWILKSKFIVKQEIVWINRSQNFDKIRFYPFTERVYWLAKDYKTKLNNIINKQDVFDWKEWKPVGTKKHILGHFLKKW